MYDALDMYLAWAAGHSSTCRALLHRDGIYPSPTLLRFEPHREDRATFSTIRFTQGTNMADQKDWKHDDFPCTLYRLSHIDFLPYILIHAQHPQHTLPLRAPRPNRPTRHLC